MEEDPTPIQNFYEGKNVFITGVTGLVGKAILEKLLYSCSGVGTCYVMMRDKKGKTPEERLEIIFKKELFNRLRESQPDFKKKVVIICGDMLKPQYGISDEDFELLKDNVDIVFHSAARVNWDDTLKNSCAHHVEATYELLRMIHQFPKLEAFVHLSTLFVHRDPDYTIPEYVVTQSVTPRQLLDTISWLDDEGIEKLVPHIVKGKSIIYTFTKGMAEVVVAEERGDIPTAIVRPSLISPSLKEPFPGWGDAMQGPQGVFLAGAKGFLRTLYSFKGLRIIVVPLDVVVNCAITAAWDVAITRPKDVLVLNCASEYTKAPLAGKDMLNLVLEKREKYPLATFYRYPDFTLYYSPIPYYIHATFDEYIPAVIGDTLLYIFTGKTIMWKTYRQIHFLFSIFVKLADNPWICKLENLHKLEKRLSEKDAEMFSMDADNIDWNKYVDDMLIAGRRIVAKEDPSTIPYAQKKMKIWWYVTTFLKWCLILALVYFVLSRVSLPTFEPSLDRYPFSPTS